MAKKRKRSGSNSIMENRNSQNKNLKEKKEEQQNKEDMTKEDKESKSGEKEIEKKMEKMTPTNAEEMKMQKKKIRKRKKKGGLQMEGRENGEEKKEEEKKDLKVNKDEKGEGKEEKKGDSEERVNGEDKEEGKKKQKRKKKKKKGGLQMEGRENGDEKEKKDLQGVNKEEKEEGKEEKKEGMEEGVNGEGKEEGKKKEKRRKKKKKVLQIEGVKEENMEEEKMKKENLQMEEGVNAEKEEGKKTEEKLSQEEEKKEKDNNEPTKKKRKRKKKKKKVTNDTNTTSTNTITITTTTTTITTPPSPSGQKKRKGKMEQGTESNVIKEEKGEKIDDDASPAKKMKIEANESDKDGTGKKKRKKKKKKKGKMSQEGNAAMNESKDEGKEIEKENMNENNNGMKVVTNKMNKQTQGEGKTAKTNKKNVENETKEENGSHDITEKEDNKTDETEKGEEKKGKKRRKKRKRKGNQSDSSAKDEGKEKEEEEEEEEEEVPVKKMRKEDTKENEEEEEEKIGKNMKKENKKKQKTRIISNTKLKNATQPNENNKKMAEENEDKETPAKKMKKEEKNKNQETKIEAENEVKNTSQPILTASQKKKLRKKKKALEREVAGVTVGFKETSEATATATSSRDSSVVVPVLHSCCGSEESKEKIKNGWQQAERHEESVVEGDVEVIRKPFLSCYVKNLLENEAFLEGVKKELADIPLLAKNNDLYKFHQTPDLKNVTTPYISALRDFLYNDMRVWLQDITGLPLQDTVDMGSSRYSYTDVLLCHDDVLEGRLIAYILYLVPPWTSDDGGTLDLFSCDDSGQPKEIVRSLVPKNNAFAFFQVCPTSFHQVSEVLSRNKTRLSINGWFHGPPVTQQQGKTPPPLPPDAPGQSDGSGKCSILPPPFTAPGDFEEEDFYAWINPIYLDPDTQREIRRKFSESSEVALENFLTQEVNEKVSMAMWHYKAWKQSGPPNRQSYQYIPWDDMPQEVRECQRFLQCEAFFLVLSQLTGLRLHAMAPQDSDDDSEDEKDIVQPNPRSRVEVQRWSHKCYTLLRDDDCTDRRSALDAYLFNNVHRLWRETMGGHISYIEKDEDEELLTVEPKGNCLSLVYCDSQTLHFTKYINSSSLGLENNSHYYNISCVYYE